MIWRVLAVLCWAARFAPAQELVCKRVEGDRISGKELAEALPVFRALPPEALLGNMPPPGSRRTFHAPELASLAEQYSIRLDPPEEVCFEWRMEPLDRGRILAAMRESLANPEARIEITETSSYPVPHGRLEFPRETLGRPASAAQENPVLWRGEVVYSGDQRYAVWAKVRVKVACQRMIALEALKPRQPVEPRQVRVEPGECFPPPDGVGRMPSVSLSGMVPFRAIAAGSEIRPEFLTLPYDVNRGDTVHVEVTSGAARLAFAAKAESGGRAGDFIAVRNPSSNKIFQARIQDKGRVVVQTEPAAASP
jgi:flagella basal body P-ring formation protein FlgA